MDKLINFVAKDFAKTMYEEGFDSFKEMKETYSWNTAASAFILSKLGIATDKTFNNSTAYLKEWLEVLKSDTRFIVHASRKAEEAFNYIFGIEN